MKNLYKYSLALATIGLIACSADEVANPGNSEETQILLKSEVVETRTPNTDLQKTQLASGLQVGMFVVKDDGSFKYENQAITADGAGYFTGNALYYPKEGSVSLYAYAPYNADWTFGENTFTVSSDQSTDAGYLASDLLYAEPNTEENKFDRSNTTAIALAHSHKLAKITLKFNVIDETDMNGATISVTNTLPSVTLNTTNGELGEASGDAVNIKAHVSTKSEGEAASVVIVPQTLPAETPFVQIVIKGGTSAMQAKLSTEVTFESGKSYTYTVNMTADAVSIEMASSVQDWVGGSDLSGKAHEVEVPDQVLYATFQTPGGNASYSAPTYTWTESTNNLMTIFEFANGELAQYQTLTLNLANLNGSVRVGYVIDGTYTNFTNENGGTNFGSGGEKVIDLTSQGIDLSKVTAIRFGGQSSEGSVDILASEIYLTGKGVGDWGDGSDNNNSGNDNTGDNNGGNNNGGSANGLPYATFQTPAANATYSGSTYTWTAGNNNLMTVFEFPNGELAKFTTLTFNISNLASGSSVRIGYYIDGNYTNFVNSNGGTNFGSNGEKVIDLTKQGIDLSKVEKIAFGGQSSEGSVDIVASDMYLSGSGSGSTGGSTGGGSTGGDNTGTGTPDKWTATFGTPGGNATYTGSTYTWTGSTNNLMTMFEFPNGELANYSKLTFTFSDISDGAAVRCGYYVGDTFTAFNNGYYSNGTKEITLSELGVDLKTVTKISFGGHSGSGSCTIKASDCYLSK